MPKKKAPGTGHTNIISKGISDAIMQQRRDDLMEERLRAAKIRERDALMEARRRKRAAADRPVAAATRRNNRGR